MCNDVDLLFIIDRKHLQAYLDVSGLHLWKGAFCILFTCWMLQLASCSFENVPNCLTANPVIKSERDEVCMHLKKYHHCLLNNDGLHGFTCFNWKWVQAGYCPYYNNYQGNLDERQCFGEPEECPKEMYKSYKSINYPGCYKSKSAKQKKNRESSPVTLAPEAQHKSDSLYHKLLQDDKVTTDTGGNKKSWNYSHMIAPVLLATIFPIIILAGSFVAYFIYKKRVVMNSADTQRRNHTSGSQGISSKMEQLTSEKEENTQCFNELGHEEVQIIIQSLLADQDKEQTVEKRTSEETTPCMTVECT